MKMMFFVMYVMFRLEMGFNSLLLVNSHNKKLLLLLVAIIPFSLLEEIQIFAFLQFYVTTINQKK